MSETKPFERVINIKSEIRQGYSPSQAQTWLDGILVYHASEFEDAVNTGEKLLREAYAEIDRLEAESTYEGQTAKEWHDAWDRENDAWQALVMHHEEVEIAARYTLANIWNAIASAPANANTSAWKKSAENLQAILAKDNAAIKADYKAKSTGGTE